MMKILDFKKRIGFILTATALFFYLVGLICYISFISGAGKPYASNAVIVINVIFFIICLAASFIKYTEKYSPIVLAIASLMTFITFLGSSYMYFSVIFYDGINIAALFSDGLNFTLGLISYLLTFVISSVAIYFKQGKEQFDVKDPNTKLTKGLKIGKVATMALTNVLTFAFAIVIAATPILMDNASSITSALGQPTYIEITYDDGYEEDAEYFTSDKKSVKEMKSYTSKIIQEAVEEGAVLLKNDNNTLPLAEGNKISFFSSSSVDLVNGCGSSENTDPKATLKDGALAAGLEVNEDLWNWYVTNTQYKRTYTSDKFTRIFTLHDALWSELPTSKTVGDAAVLVISRDAGEGVDPTYYGGRPTANNNGNYLQLSNEEKDLLDNLNVNFEKVIVIINAANELQIDFEADAILWVGNIGTSGAYGVGNLLAGKSSVGTELSPSGHASDTFWKEHRFNPVLANFGATSYTNRVIPSIAEINATCSKTKDSQALQSNNYTVYQEGIYNGYRYSETRYEDMVLGRTNTGDFVYEDVVAYPFGYGESYTTFSFSNYEVNKVVEDNKTIYRASITITNTGSYHGKAVAEAYLQKPYTQYDIEHFIEKSSVELVGFNKTRNLAPLESQTLTIDIPEEYFASFDAYGEQTYILDEGDYYLTIASDAHNAVNNILMKKDIDAVAIARMVGEGNANLVNKYHYDFDNETYKTSKETGKEITNQFDDVDLNRYIGAGDNQVDYISRNNWNDTVKYGVDELGNKLSNQVVITGTDKMKEDIKNPTIEEDDVEYPTYGSTASSYRLIDVLKDDWDFNDPRWNDLLDQLTWDDTVKLLSAGVRSTQPLDSVSKRGTLDYNGAIGPIHYNYSGNGITGLAYRNNDPDMNTKPNCYVSNGVLAATFNEEFINRYGKAMGEDCLWCGYNGLYGPGVNIHRSAFGGRGFEYYSEDPILTGKIAASQIRGIQEYGTYCYVKHAICNDSEVMREGINIWANEQSLREIYLRPFEICIKEGKAPNVMSGFNRLGLKWNGHQGYLKSVLREEFGMEGFAISDWYDERTWYMTSYGGLLNGNDLPDGTYSSSVNSACMFSNYRSGYGKLANAMRDAAHRMLYIIGKSNVMNGLSSNMDTFTIVPKWLRTFKRAKKAVTGIFISVASIFAAVTVSYYLICILKNKKVNKENAI